MANVPDSTYYSYAINQDIEVGLDNVSILLDDKSVLVSRLSYNRTTGSLTGILISQKNIDCKYTICKCLGEERLKNGAFNFVFGVNISYEDWEKVVKQEIDSNIRIYCSLQQFRDQNIYASDKETVIGQVANLLEAISILDNATVESLLLDDNKNSIGKYNSER